MQQVAAKVFADAQPVDPRQLPIPIFHRPGRRGLLVVANHAWVLHRPLLLRILAGLIVLIALGAVFELRGQIFSAAQTAYRYAEQKIAQQGFGITSIKITGQKLTSDRDIVELLNIGNGSSTLTFDAQKAQARLSWLRAVKSATVRKIYPNQVVVDIVEQTPMVRWRTGNTTWLIDENGDEIGTDVGSYTELPLVIGDGAADDAIPMVQLLQRHPKLLEGMAALSRIGDRRWDLIYRNGLRIELPEVGIAAALNHLDNYQNQYALLDRDVTQIDLRVNGFVTLKPGPVAAKQIADQRKKTKHAIKGGDAEYETAAERAAEAKAQ